MARDGRNHERSRALPALYEGEKEAVKNDLNSANLLHVREDQQARAERIEGPEAVQGSFNLETAVKGFRRAVLWA